MWVLIVVLFANCVEVKFQEFASQNKCEEAAASMRSMLVGTNVQVRANCIQK
jgi:hypothetical protein